MIDCKRCGCSFTLKNNLKNHINKKTQCDPIISNMSRDDLLDDIDTQKTCFICELCDKTFSSKQGKYQHKQKCIISHEKNNIIKLQTQIDEIRNINITNNNQQINNINITIPKLNDFGRENMDAIPETLVSTLFMDLRFRELLANLHCDPNYPENHNVRIKSIKRNTMEIFRNNKWDIMTFSKGLTELLLQGHKIFKEYYKKDKDRILEEDMNESEIREVLDQLDQIEKLSKDELKPLLEDLQMMLEEYRENGSAIILA
jgi:hypothetical protein